MDPQSQLALIKSRRNIRRFQSDKAVPPEALHRILEAATWAPLSIYAPQGWRFVAFQGDQREQVAAQVTRDHTILKYVRHMYEASPLGTDEPWKELAQDFGKTLGQAPVVVLVLVRTDDHGRRMEHNLGAAWAATQNALLQATAEGLGSGIVSMSSRKVRMGLVEMAGLDPDEWRVVCAINLGYPAEEAAPSTRDSSVVEVRG